MGNLEFDSDESQINTPVMGIGALMPLVVKQETDYNFCFDIEYYSKLEMK